MVSSDNFISFIERLAAAACLALAGIFMSMFLQPLFPPGSWIWLFLALVMIGAALYRLWMPTFFSWRWPVQVFVLIVMALLAWSASAIFPGEQQQQEALLAPLAAPPSREEEQTTEVAPPQPQATGEDENPMDLDSTTASVRSGRQVRAPGYEGEDFVLLTVAEIVAPLWGLTDVQERRETSHYIGKRYVISGRIDDVAEADAGRGLVVMATPLREPGVNAWLTGEEFVRVVNMRKGDTLTLAGRFQEVDARSITLQDCEVIEQ